ESDLQARVVTKDVAYGSDNASTASTYALARTADDSGIGGAGGYPGGPPSDIGSGSDPAPGVGSESSTGYTELRDSWAIYSFGSGFGANMDGDTLTQRIADILDQKADSFEQLSLDEKELMRGLMRAGYSGNLNENAQLLRGASYDNVPKAAMNINQLVSNITRDGILTQPCYDDNEWHWFGQPVAFSAREQGINGYSQNGNGVLLGVDKQIGNTNYGFYGGYLHDSTSFTYADNLRSKRDGGFVGAYFKNAPKDNGAFAYGFVRYDNSNAKNKRHLNINDSYKTVHEADLRQQGMAAEFGGGWQHTTKKGAVSYLAGLNYGLVHSPSFKESGEVTNVAVEGGDYEALTGLAQVRYTTNRAVLNKVTDYRVSAAATWNQELYRSDRDYSVGLLGGNIPVHWENQEDKGWLDLSLQGEFIFKKNLAVVASVGTELFRKNHRGLSGSIKLEYGF
ncbi:MAG: autotransporter outer membrane beta-barrel domain-containing protein, partial [Phascolarctobacterium sp.]